MSVLEKGKVYLVGAGPGDPGLITVKGIRCLAGAEVVVYDRLVDQRLLHEAPTQAELIYVGKTPQRHTLKQSQINQLLVEKAREGKSVVRLKGGDPFLFGRGGEEAEALAEAGVPFEVVPGVTAATAVPAYAGIPVTHRGHASSFAVVTGHEEPGKGESRIAWDKLATGVDTIAFLMGVENLSEIAAQLMSHGRPPTTPVALIGRGTGPRQETLVGTLSDIAQRAAEARFTSPAVILVGEVVSLREKLRWFDNRPLFGRRVLVTRTRKQASALSELLAQKGAEPVELPVIEIEAEPLAPELDVAISRLSSYHWIVFTSANGVEAFFARLRALGKDARAFGQARVCAIGPATAAALERCGLLADLVPGEYIAEGIIDAFQEHDLTGRRVLLPRAEAARQDLVQGLARLGARVDEVPAYRTVPASEVGGEGRELLLSGQIDVVTFTSSSTVKNLASLVGTGWQSEHTLVACIGPATARMARELGLRVDIQAGEYTIPGLVQAIVDYYQRT